MAESFKNFIGNIKVKSGTNPTIIIPVSGTSTSSGSREQNTVAQVHSIYITQVPGTKIQGLNRYEPANFFAFNLGIKRGSTVSYIVYDGRVAPGSPFFIEKNITLETDQSLIIECPSDSYDYKKGSNDNRVLLNQDGNGYLHFTASAVLFPDS